MNMPSLIKIMNRLMRAHSKRIFTLGEMSLIANESAASVGMALLRARKNGLVERVGRVWFSLTDPPTIEELALSLRQNSYISFESALYRRNILSQSPRGLLTVATLGRPARVKTPLGEIEFIHLVRRLFFGFDAERIAIAEKAWLDMAYIRVRRGTWPGSEVIDTDELNMAVVRKYLKRYPVVVSKRIASHLSQFDRL